MSRDMGGKRLTAMTERRRWAWGRSQTQSTTRGGTPIRRPERGSVVGGLSRRSTSSEPRTRGSQRRNERTARCSPITLQERAGGSWALTPSTRSFVHVTISRGERRPLRHLSSSEDRQERSRKPLLDVPALEDRRALPKVPTPARAGLSVLRKGL